MKRGFLLIAFISLVHHVAYSQIVRTDISPAWEKPSGYCTANGSNLIYFIHEQEQLHVLVYDSNLALLNKGFFSISGELKGNVGVIAVANIDDHPTLLFSNKKLRTFFVVSVGTDSMMIDKRVIEPLSDKDVYIGTFVAQNRFYLICLRDSNPAAMVIKEIKADLNIEEHLVPLNDLPFNLAFGNDIWELFFARITKDAVMKNIHQDEPNTDYTAFAPSKYYYDNNELIFTFNQIPDTTQILTINLTDFSRRFIKIGGGSLCKKDRTAQDNSFVFENKLFYAAACQKQLALKMFDLKSGELIKEYVTESDQPISYASGHFVESLKGNSAKVVARESQYSTSKIIKMISNYEENNSMGIGAFINKDGNIEVTIGGCSASPAYYYSPFGISYFNYMMPPPGMYTGGFHLLLSSLFWTTGYSTLGFGYSNNYFKSYFNRENLAPVKMDNIEGLPELLNTKVKALKDDDAQAICAINFRGKVILAYYQPEQTDKQFSLEVIEKY